MRSFGRSWRIAFVMLASMSAGANLSMMPKMPLAFRELVNAHTGPVIYTLGTTTVLLILFLFRSPGSCSRRLRGRFGT